MVKLLIISLILLTVSACSGTVKEGVRPEKRTSVSDSEGRKVLELKARIDELNSRLFSMTEQLESMRARLRQEGVEEVKEVKEIKEPVVEVAKKKISPPPEGLTAEQMILQRYLSRGRDEDSMPDIGTTRYRQMHDAYIRAYSFFNVKQYARALVAFNSFIESYPQTPLTDNAYFWMGECYYNKKEHELAIQEYLKVIENFPNSSKVPMALLKLSSSYDVLNDSAASRRYRDLLLERHPDSRAASMIRDEKGQGR